ncbi:peptidase inhibitor family I36 protein [Actinomadura sp. 9N215]|uniref:peptidase inhibitor family I36 protein n=1 Tax=Actinomadura sp. 9N215 TaxID=3375150 RepID=UPI0037A3D241
MRSPLLTRIVAVAGVAAAAAMTAAGTATATADELPSAQDQINRQLRDHPGGIQTGSREVAYQGGRVILSFPTSDGAGAACASGAYCFYDGVNFTGRTLTFRDCGGWQYLTDYGFGNKTSSWRNITKHHVQVHDLEPEPIKLLWTETPRTDSSNVGSAADNRADGFRTLCGS